MLRRLLIGVLLTYLLLCGAMFVLQRQLQYRPDITPLDATQAARHGYIQETLSTPDGQTLMTWWSPPQDTTAPVILYLHGNGANVAARAERLTALRADGAGVLALSWRGYGGSSGSPDEGGLLTDARSAWRVMKERAPRQPALIYGESLGTTVAVMLAAEVQADALILDSSFDSALAVAAGRYPWLPVSWLLKDTYRADLAAPRVRAPVLQIHCRDDPVTPLPHAQALGRLFPAPEPMALVEDRCHVPAYSRYRAAVQEMLGRHLAAVGARPKATGSDDDRRSK